MTIYVLPTLKLKKYFRMRQALRLTISMIIQNAYLYDKEVQSYERISYLLIFHIASL